MHRIFYLFSIVFSAQLFIDTGNAINEDELQRMLDKGKWIIDEAELQKILELAADDGDQVVHYSVDEYFRNAFDIPFSRKNQELGNKALDEQTRRRIAEETYKKMDVNGDGLIQKKEMVAMFLKMQKDKHYRRERFNAEIADDQREYEEGREAFRRKLDGMLEEEQRKYDTAMKYYADRAMIDKMEPLRLSHGAQMADLREKFDGLVKDLDRKQNARVQKRHHEFDERDKLVKKHSWSELKFPENKDSEHTEL